jgi:uncharacterized protein (TIGR03382 family)
MPTCRRIAFVCCTVGALFTGAVLPALAADSQRDLRPGVTYFERTTTGARPQHVHAVGVDLRVPNVGLHASKDVRGSEWDVNTLTFANNTQSLAAINGDWSCIPQSACGADFHRPMGLAISGGQMWNPHRPTEDIGATWGYIGCTLGKQCDLEVARPLDHPDMVFSPLHNPTIKPLRYQNAVGGNGLVLINNGVRGTGCFDTGTDTPRSAVCVQADGVHLWMVVVDGRGANDGDTGMTCDETRDLLLGAPFLCRDAIMLDGGGSSTLVMEDTTGSTCRSGRCIKNNPSDGAPRTVGNHLGIIYSDTLDPRCQVPNGRWCDGTVISTCEGGRFEGSGDCGAFGAGCQEDGDHAFCVHPFCPAGNGLDSRACTDATHIASCTDGQLSNGDCGAFGLVCGGASGAAQCMDPRCEAGPDGAFCTAGGQVGSCAGGVFTATACAQGRVCSGTGAVCVDARCTGGDSVACSAGDVRVACAGGEWSEVNCAASGGTCDSATATCVGRDAGGPVDGGNTVDAAVAPAMDAGRPDAARPDAAVRVDSGAADGSTSQPSSDAGEPAAVDASVTSTVDAGEASAPDADDAEARTGCAATGVKGIAPLAWVALGLLRRRRRGLGDARPVSSPARNPG